MTFRLSRTWPGNVYLEKGGQLRMNLKFVARGVVVGELAAFTFALVGFLVVLPRTPLGSPLDPTPLPPTIVAPHGEMPFGPIGLAEYAYYRGSEYKQVGSGFILKLESGDQVGVTTAHSVALGNPDRPLERLAFRIPGQPGYAAEFGSLYGTPGRAMEDSDLTVDYVLLRVDGLVDPTLCLIPDPRGGPQPGERVSLFSGIGEKPGRWDELSGTVISADKGAAWVLMDKESFNPGQMSGSPLVSHHTGQVVGMAIAAAPRHLRLLPPRYRIVLGIHPIGSIVEKAEAADSFPAIGTYQQ